MPKLRDDTPAALRPYVFHGVDLAWQDGEDEAWGECPFCGRDDHKFSVNLASSKSKCLHGSCDWNDGGNGVQFLRKLHELGGTEGIEQLMTDRNLLSPATLRAWGVCRSPVTGDWLVPGYGHGQERKLDQLYAYSGNGKGGKRLLLATRGFDLTLVGTNLYNPKVKTVYLCEGPWDAMCLWEVLRQTKVLEGELAPTGSVVSSIGGQCNVLAVTGANVYKEEWYRFFAGKRVVLLFDNDHPHGNNGKTTDGAGYAGMRRTAQLMSKSAEPPESIHYLVWGPNGYNPELPSGYDVRDLLTSGGATLEARVTQLGRLLQMTRPVPEDWIPGRGKEAVRQGGTGQDCLPCTNWAELVLAWQQAMRWPAPGEGLDHALACMLACSISTAQGGDQLWIRVIGQPSSGKSVLAEALSTNRRYVLAKSVIRGFHSGYRSKEEGGGDEDNSLLAVSNGKTLITKDGDTLLQSPNLDQILGEARDVYDRVARTHYRNKVSREYKNQNTTWILMGTGALRQLDTSELGERFLTVDMYGTMTEGLEDEIALLKAYQARRALLITASEANGADDPETTRAKRLTGGYLGYIRDNATILIRRAEHTMDDKATLRCAKLAKWVACLRARPSTKQAERAERELCFRLTSQLTRMAVCLAAVLGCPVDEGVMARVAKAAHDTAGGRTLEILKYLNDPRWEGKGAETPGVVALLHEEEAAVGKLLNFLRKIDVLERYRPELAGGRVRGPVRWRPSQQMLKLYREVMR